MRRRRQTHHPEAAARTEKVNTNCPLYLENEGHCHRRTCGRPLTGRQSRWCSRACAAWFTLNHRWTNARKAAKAAATWYQCAACAEFFRNVEVNHIVPCVGERGWSCHHHSTNLECLCRPCHLLVTADQRKKGLI